MCFTGERQPRAQVMFKTIAQWCKVTCYDSHPSNSFSIDCKDNKNILSFVLTLVTYSSTTERYSLHTFHKSRYIILPKWLKKSHYRKWKNNSPASLFDSLSAPLDAKTNFSLDVFDGDWGNLKAVDMWLQISLQGFMWETCCCIITFAGTCKNNWSQIPLRTM